MGRRRTRAAMAAAAAAAVVLLCCMCAVGVEAKPPAKDPYRVLGVKRDATAREIKSAYRAAARKAHPDKINSGGGAGRDEAASAFVMLGEAYEILSSPEKRRNYDATGDPEVSAAAAAYGGGGGGGGRGWGGYPRGSGGSAALFSTVPYLTSESYGHVVETSHLPVWAILFYTDGERSSADALAMFGRVHSSLRGVAGFGRVETRAEWRLARQFQLSRVPVIILFQGGRYRRYRGPLTARALRADVVARIENESPSSAPEVVATLASSDPHAHSVIARHVAAGWPVVVGCSSKAKPKPLFKELAHRLGKSVAFVHMQIKPGTAPALAELLGQDVLVPSTLVAVRSVSSGAGPAAATSYLGDVAFEDIAQWVIGTAGLLTVPEVDALNFGRACGLAGPGTDGCVLVVSENGCPSSGRAFDAESPLVVALERVQAQLVRDGTSVRLARVSLARESGWLQKLGASGSDSVFVSALGQRSLPLAPSRPSQATDDELEAWLWSLVESATSSRHGRGRGAVKHKVLPWPTAAGPGRQAGTVSRGGSWLGSVSWAVRSVGYVVQTVLSMVFSLAIFMLFLCPMLFGGRGGFTRFQFG